MNIVLFDNIPRFIDSSDSRGSHILDVLHLKEGDSFRMGVINESEGSSRIDKIEDNKIYISYTPLARPQMYPVTLLVAHVRPICMKRILREAVSLGVGSILLTGSDTGEKSYLNSNLFKTDEFKEYLLDGAMQSCSAGLSSIQFADKVENAVQMAGFKEDTSYIMLDNITGSTKLSQAHIKNSAVIAIGPERGWSERERNIFLQHGYSSMLLGSRVLRTETACSAGVSVLLTRMGYI